MLYSPTGVPIPDAQLETLSKCVVHLDMANVEIVDGKIIADSGHVFTLTRAATGTATDSNNVSYTAGYHQPRLEARDWLNLGARQTMGLLMGTADRLHADIVLPIGRDWSWYMELIEVAGDTGFYIGNDGVSGGRHLLDKTGGNVYSFIHHDGTSSVASTAAATVSAGNRLRLRGKSNASGSVQIWQSINGGAEATPGASATKTPLAYGTTTRINFNALGTGAMGSMWLRRFKLMWGSPTLAQLQEVR